MKRSGMFAVLYTFHDSNCADRGGRGKSSSYTLEHLYAFTRCLRFVSFFEHTVCNSVTTSEASLLLHIACLTPCRSLTIISSWILLLHFFFTLSISARCFTHIDGLDGIFHSHRTLYTYTSFCSVTSLFSSTHGRGWWEGQESWVMLESEHRCIY